MSLKLLLKVFLCLYSSVLLQFASVNFFYVYLVGGSGWNLWIYVFINPEKSIISLNTASLLFSPAGTDLHAC